MPMFMLSHGDHIVFEGDSLTNRRTGKGKSTWPYLQLMHWDYTWADYFSQLAFCWAPHLELKFTNAAVGGSKSTDLLERLDFVTLPLAPDLVLATIGGNDRNVGIPLDQFEENLREFTTRLNEAHGTRTAFIVIRHLPSDIARDYPNRKEYWKKRMEYMDVLDSLASEMEYVHVVDITSGFADKSEAILAQHEAHEMQSDGGHYNNIANTIIAGEILKALNLLP